MCRLLRQRMKRNQHFQETKENVKKLALHVYKRLGRMVTLWPPSVPRTAERVAECRRLFLIYRPWFAVLLVDNDLMDADFVPNEDSDSDDEEMDDDDQELFPIRDIDVDYEPSSSEDESEDDIMGEDEIAYFIAEHDDAFFAADGEQPEILGMRAYPDVIKRNVHVFMPIFYWALQDMEAIKNTVTGEHEHVHESLGKQ
jgi:hypothetical protein